MLHTLELRDFAIVDELELDLAEGLNVLTGETGAGKSIVVDALELLSGGRPDAAMIRTGAEAALVQATFEAAPLASASRRVAANGRHGARLNGELVSVAELAEAVGGQLQVFGQHSAGELLSPASQREQLDRLLPAADAAVLERHRSAYAELQAATNALERLEGARLER
ncbi:MAG TPA: AAA family ATPase, partial [Trueperaceae bacterium]|nr:AAA family ATPase [Trueperaceae bacterium]